MGCVLLFFLFAWDRVATVVVVHRLRAVTGRPRTTMAPITGAFPFHFNVPLLNIPGWGRVDGLDVTYDGTYNPFQWTSQTGPLMHAKAAAVRVHVAGHDMVVPVDHVAVTRYSDHQWGVNVRSRWHGMSWTASARFGPSRRPSLNVTVDSVFRMTATPNRFRATYADHTVVDVRVYRAPDTTSEVRGSLDVVATLGDLVHVHVYGIHTASTEVSIDHMDVGTLTTPLHLVLEDGLVTWGKGTDPTAVTTSFREPAAGVSSSLRVDAQGVVGTLRGVPWHMAWKTNREVRWSPPLATPWGSLATATIDAPLALPGTLVFSWLDPARPRVVFGPGLEMHWGPIAIEIGRESAQLTIAGGRFRRFECVNLHGSLYYADPTLLVLDRVAVVTGTEHLHGTGEYALSERTLRFSFNVEIST